jgi:hypothetical protein
LSREQVGTGRGTPGRVIWAGVAVLVVLVAVGGYLGAGVVVAAGYRQSAERTLAQAGTENDKIYGLLKKPPSGPVAIKSDQDLAQAKSALDEAGASLKQSHTIVGTELPRLGKASQNLRAESGGLLMVTQRGSLDEERGRIDSAIAGFSAAGEYLTIEEEQVRFASVLLDAEVAVAGVLRVVEQQNLAGALAQYPQVDSKVEQLRTLSRGQNIAPQLQALTNSVVTFSTDFKQFLQATQAGDVPAVQTLESKLDQDGKASASFDQAGYDAYQTQLAKPYVDRYERAMTRAGFKLVGQPQA